MAGDGGMLAPGPPGGNGPGHGGRDRDDTIPPPAPPAQLETARPPGPMRIARAAGPG